MKVTYHGRVYTAHYVDDMRAIVLVDANGLMDGPCAVLTLPLSSPTIDSRMTRHEDEHTHDHDTEDRRDAVHATDACRAGHAAGR